MTVALRAQRVSASPPGGDGARTPENAPSGRRLARKTSGEPTTAGAVGALTVNEPSDAAVVAPATRQSFGPPDAGPTPTRTAYTPLPSNWIATPTGTTAPAATPATPVQNGALSGCVACPSGTPVIWSAARCAPGDSTAYPTS